MEGKKKRGNRVRKKYSHWVKKIKGKSRRAVRTAPCTRTRHGGKNLSPSIRREIEKTRRFSCAKKSNVLLGPGDIRDRGRRGQLAGRGRELLGLREQGRIFQWLDQTNPNGKVSKLLNAFHRDLRIRKHRQKRKHRSQSRRCRGERGRELGFGKSK